jgi:hypothetical protein
MAVRADFILPTFSGITCGIIWEAKMGDLSNRFSECRAILLARAVDRRTIYYGELATALGLPLPRQKWSTVLDPIREHEIKRVGKDLSQIVVYATGPAKGLPRYFSNRRGAPRSELLDPKDHTQVAAFKAELESIFDLYQKQS